MVERTPGRLVPVLLALVVGAVGADIVRRVAARPAAASSATTPPAGATAGGEVARRVDGPVRVTHDSTADAARRVAVRERIRREGAGTYLAEMLAETDSMIRRWPEGRERRGLRLAVLRAGAVDNFREAFVSNVSWAVMRWNGAMLPVQLESGADSASADVVLTWVARLDGNRTGRADLTWDQRGHIVHAQVFLATHTPDGTQLDARQMTALALHELGHALGLGHSPAREDALHPVTRAIELTERDRRTARLLYSLPPGSLR